MDEREEKSTYSFHPKLKLKQSPPPPHQKKERKKEKQSNNNWKANIDKHYSRNHCYGRIVEL